MSSTKAIRVLYCCSDYNKDEEMRQKLEKHLSILQRQGAIATWHKSMISAGKEWESEIETQLMTADIILPLISSDFFTSNYHWDVVTKRAMERHRARKARVIPIVLTTVDNWRVAFPNVKALPQVPEGEKPVSKWGNYDHAFENIAKGIRDVVEELTASPFSLKAYPQFQAGMTAVARTVASVPAFTASIFAQPSQPRRRRRLKPMPVITPLAVIGVLGGTVALTQLPHLLGVSSLAPKISLPSTQNVRPIGWIRIGVVNNIPGSLSAGERLLQSSNPRSNPRLAPSIDYPVVPSIGAVVTVKTPVNLRKNKPQPYLGEKLGLLKPGEKLIIVKLAPLVILDSNSPRTEAWAQVARCNRGCDK